MTGITELCLLGTIARAVEVSCSDRGAQIARTALCLAEEREGQVYKTFVPIEAWRKSTETLGELSRGALVLVKQRLKYRSGRKEGKKTDRLEVSTWSVHLVQAVAEAIA
jgi:single-stranded DNA-binding protein